MGETTSQFRVNFEEKKQRNELSVFIKEFLNPEEPRYQLISEKKILSQRNAIDGRRIDFAVYSLPDEHA